jgi:hypothetical protein
MILIKITGNGSEEWTQTFGSETETDDLGYAMQQTADGCYILLGTTSGDEQAEVYLVKTCGEMSTSSLLTTPSIRQERIIDL